MLAALAGRPGRLFGILAIGSAAVLALVRTQPPRVRADGPAPPTVDFNRDIRPLLSDNCFACHGPDDKQRKAKLRFDTHEGALAKLRGGNAAVVPGKPDESALVERVSADDPKMVMPPPKSGKKLTTEQKELLRRWIAQGAPWSGHWAFEPPQKPAAPMTGNPIDYFIRARLAKAGLRPAPEADRATLIRRVTLDLTGLPPTPAEVDAFLADTSPHAYEGVVDRLLRSPRYGEHMARLWLDAARYGDTHGLHLDNYREMWPYRDWVVQAFNANLPYDRFVIEQLAGDLLPGATTDQQVASGFNRCHVTTSEGGSIVEEVYVRNVVDRVDTTGTVFLGLSVGCARCHDHKYDPITQKDFYSLFAFFNSLDQNPLDGNAARHPPVLRLPTPEQTAALSRFQRVLDALRKTLADEVAKVELDAAGEAELAAWLAAVQTKGGAGLPSPILNLVKVEPAKRTPAQQKQLRDHYVEHVWPGTRPTFAPLHQSIAALEKERDQLDKQVLTTLVSLESANPKPAYILKRGEYDQRGEEVGRATPGFLPPLAPRGRGAGGEGATSDRLDFARWLVAPENPLTARVAVNRLWQQCVGAGLVLTAEDFGSQGEPPSHPELLDWLAVQFQDDGWDVQRMLKRIVTSATYRQASALSRRPTADPDNRLLARGPRHRLDAETLRDQALAASGLLVEKLGGPGVKPPQPYGLWEAVGYLTSNTRNFVADTGHDKVHRRSLYTFWKRTAPPPQMAAFDAPSREACRVRRERTNTPLQALVLLNDTQYVECARALAERTMKEGGASAEERAAYLFRLATCRRPDAKELAELVAVYRDHLAAFTKDVEAAKKLVAVGETKPDAALNPAELAAWTMVGNLVLNLDEMVNKG